MRIYCHSRRVAPRGNSYPFSLFPLKISMAFCQRVKIIHISTQSVRQECWAYFICCSKCILCLKKLEKITSWYQLPTQSQNSVSQETSSQEKSTAWPEHWRPAKCWHCTHRCTTRPGTRDLTVLSSDLSPRSSECHSSHPRGVCSNRPSPSHTLMLK